MSGPPHQHGPRPGKDGGSALIEFIFVAVLVLVPLVYLIVAVAEVQRSRLAVTNAAREVGRAIEARQPGSDPEVAAEAALRIALRSQGLQPADVEVGYVASHRDCSTPAITPELSPGSEFTVCVTQRQQLPGVPAIIDGRPITMIGRYVVHLDEFRAHR